ncbi:MAG: short chain dehydrogenase [Variovorax sp.]
MDISSAESLRALFAQAGPLDGVVCAAGAARFKPLAQLEDDDFSFSLQNKLMGQVNLIRLALQHVRDGGAIVVTSGILSRLPAPGGGAISLVNAGLEGFARAAALEAPRGIRLNVVSPPWVSETLVQLGMDPKGGLPATIVAQAYVKVVEGSMTGQVIEPSASA